MAREPLRISINGEQILLDAHPPTMTLLEFLRGPARLTATKEGCAEGDCGACTVVVIDDEGPGAPRPRAVNACLILLPMVQGRRVYTAEALSKPGGVPHPVQRALVERLGSQCGYCTPGIVMSMVEAAHRDDLDADWKLDDQLCGNLCRCTGYRPIREATRAVASTRPVDVVAEALNRRQRREVVPHYEVGQRAFFSPRTYDELWDALERPGSRIVCGGTDLALEITKARRYPQVLVSVETLPQARDIEAIDGGWRIGSAVTLTDLEDAMVNAVPPITRILRFFGSRQIKHRATVGGNLCNASPIGDLAPVLLSLNATVELRCRQGSRRIPIDEFFVGYRKTALRPGEILASVDVPGVPDGARAGAYKVSKRRELDISAVAAGFVVQLGDDKNVTEARLGFGGMAATPARARRAEAVLLGRPWSEATVQRAVEALREDFTPIDDHRGSAWFRSTVAGNLLRGFFEETQADAVPALPDRPSGTVLNEVRP